MYVFSIKLDVMKGDEENVLIRQRVSYKIIPQECEWELVEVRQCLQAAVKWFRESESVSVGRHICPCPFHRKLMQG